MNRQAKKRIVIDRSAAQFQSCPQAGLATGKVRSAREGSPNDDETFAGRKQILELASPRAYIRYTASTSGAGGEVQSRVARSARLTYGYMGTSFCL